MFFDMRGRFAVDSKGPIIGCHVIDTPEEVIEFLLHEDGLALPLTYDQLKSNINDVDKWSADSEGMLYEWSLQVGFRSVWVRRTSPLPTLLVQKCLWCGTNHSGGPDFCYQNEE